MGLKYLLTMTAILTILQIIKLLIFLVDYAIYYLGYNKYLLNEQAVSSYRLYFESQEIDNDFKEEKVEKKQLKNLNDINDRSKLNKLVNEDQFTGKIAIPIRKKIDLIEDLDEEPNIRKNDFMDKKIKFNVEERNEIVKDDEGLVYGEDKKEIGKGNKEKEEEPGEEGHDKYNNNEYGDGEDDFNNDSAINKKPNQLEHDNDENNPHHEYEHGNTTQKLDTNVPYNQNDPEVSKIENDNNNYSNHSNQNNHLNDSQYNNEYHEPNSLNQQNNQISNQLKSLNKDPKKQSLEKPQTSNQEGVIELNDFDI